MPPARMRPPPSRSRVQQTSKVSAAFSLITGPIQFSRWQGSPTRMAAVFCSTFARSASATPSCTYTRERAEHFCPVRPKAERTMPVAARSRSPCAVTTQAFFPPISAMQGRGWAPPAIRR